MSRLDREDIMRIIPHRPPFLFVDEITGYEEGAWAEGLWHLSGDEIFFSGHFPGNPVLPGVLMTEALAQVGAVTIMTMPEFVGGTPLFASLKDVRFRRVVRPGDTLKLYARIDRISHGFGQGIGKAEVDGTTACEINMTFAINQQQR